MASSSVLSAAVLLVLSLFLLNSSVSVSAADDTCSAVTTKLAGCASALAGTGTAAPDQKTCCQPLEVVLKNATQFACICSLAQNQPSYITAASSIPKACNMNIAVSASNCTGLSSTSSNSSSAAGTSSATLLSSGGGLAVLGFGLISMFLRS